ncbi:Uncharacterised protein [Mycolicibacterium phlei]|uniref:hypothetical protein n=1 Tax=Mycobacteroides chelonae TaxID=1774 RepID=UPI000618D76B|nr:hypothetical protein [Mycobacteroides chelonae]VEG20097.1 Uncharacterised protein [Mycolicibacterium phlei]AKC40494.1 hypothetical protein GR01_20620 [Mycobacteroides chelonae]ANB00166.1 hypothetical protein BB28_21575 [Mycobacteroides chelonae CCUG 47445]OLT82081.1 hypothetical protein BKG56_08135 [Mycobacteroides chelonae]ORV15640.1 hypothetical protein AWB96_06230 [Mycobacteroides chelonae]
MLLRMGGDDPVNESNEPENRRFLDRYSLKRLHQVAIVAVLATTAAFGGLETAEPMTPVALGSSYSNGVYTITPHRVAEICDPARLPTRNQLLLQKAAKERQLVGLFATVENTADSSGVVLHDLKPSNNAVFSLVGDDVRDEGAYGPYGLVSVLQPGKVQDVIVVWGFPFGKAHPGDDVTIKMSDFERAAGVANTVTTWGATGHYGELRTTIGRCE